MHSKTKSLSVTPADGNVKVVCRFRPFNRKEIEMNTSCPVKFIDNRTIKILDADDQYFSFDSIFDTKSNQDEVYRAAGEPLVAQVPSIRRIQWNDICIWPNRVRKNVHNARAIHR